MTGLRNECYSSEGWGYDFTMNALASILFAVFASIPLAITLMETTYEQLREATSTTLGPLLVEVEATIVATENGTNAMTLAFDNLKASVLRVRKESKAAKAKAAAEKPCAGVDFLKSNNIASWMANMVDKTPLAVGRIPFNKFVDEAGLDLPSFFGVEDKVLEPVEAIFESRIKAITVDMKKSFASNSMVASLMKPLNTQQTDVSISALYAAMTFPEALPQFLSEGMPL
jgi:hypothetical protein